MSNAHAKKFFVSIPFLSKKKFKKWKDAFKYSCPKKFAIYARMNIAIMIYIAYFLKKFLKLFDRVLFTGPQLSFSGISLRKDCLNFRRAALVIETYLNLSSE